MAQSDAAYLESLKTARDALLAQIAAGDVVIETTTSGRTKRVADPAATLERLDKLIAVYERRVRDAAASPMRAVRLSRPS